MFDRGDSDRQSPLDLGGGGHAGGRRLGRSDDAAVTPPPAAQSMLVGLAPLDEAVDALAAVDTALVDPTDLAETVRRLHRTRDRLEAVIARFVAQAERRRVHSQGGARSMAGWLAEHCRTDRRRAYDQAATTRQLDELPAVRAAWQDGDITADHARSSAGRSTGLVTPTPTAPPTTRPHAGAGGG